MVKGSSNGRVYLDRAAILAVADIVTEEVEVPEWRCWVRVRGLTAAQRDEVEMWAQQQARTKQGPRLDRIRNARARIVSMCVVDEAGARMFAPEDIPALGEKNAAALDRIMAVAQRLSGITDDDLEELAGNSETTAFAGSPSG